ncbi:NAD-binding protein [Fodinicola feengrottensis]|uniref:NAD-binding protein n=1 Tax=Fodinicola feengrottensis TaxID=435914 RepID=A0ABN2FUC4_9ACTN
MVVCGDDTLLVRLLEELAMLDERAIAVVPDGNPEVVRLVTELGVEVVIGSPTDAGTLLSAGIERARALALVGEGDEKNVHAALVAAELNPKLRLVVRMFNLRLGQRIDDLFDDCTVLSASAIAAPSFVEAALGDGHGRSIPAGGRTFAAGAPSTVDDVVVPLARYRDDGEISLLPKSANDAFLVLGTPSESILRTVVAAATSHRGPVRRRLREWARFLGQLTDQRLRLALASLTLVVVLATALFKFALRLEWVQALYFTVTTVTTTGYGDINLAAAPPWVQLAGVVVMIMGVLVVALLTAAVVDNLVGARLVRALGPPVGKPHDHIVVCGMGTVGLRVCEQLRAAGAEVVGIEQDPSPALMAAARRLEVPLVAGDASDASTLASAGAGKARCVVAVTDDDVVNLEAGLTARALQPDTRVVLRLFDPDLADRVDRRLGLSVSRSVSYAAAPVFAAAMMGRQVLAAIPAGRRVLLVAAVPIGARSSLDGASLSTVDSGRVRIFGLRTGNAEPVWQPPGESRLVAGQVLFVVATRAGLAKILVASGAH